jgi:hypothetical protein
MGTRPIQGKKPSDPTIAEKFNTYRFADYKTKVMELLKRICTVSVETMKIILLVDIRHSHGRVHGPGGHVRLLPGFHGGFPADLSAHRPDRDQ